MAFQSDVKTVPTVPFKQVLGLQSLLKDFTLLTSEVLDSCSKRRIAWSSSPPPLLSSDGMFVVLSKAVSTACIMRFGDLRAGACG